MENFLDSIPDFEKELKDVIGEIDVLAKITKKLKNNMSIKKCKGLV